MEKIILIFVLLVVSFVVYKVYKQVSQAKRKKLIETFRFPNTISEKLVEKYPHLDDKQVAKVIEGLREYFHLCNLAGNRMVSMPSQVVDMAWHEFILFTKKYEYFCNGALGRFLHHTPAEAMQSPTAAQTGIKTAWRLSCYREDLSPKSAHRLPLLFAMDSMLKIPDGFHYTLDCTKSGNTTGSFCATHIGCSSCASCSGDSSGCSSGCGGGGD